MIREIIKPESEIYNLHIPKEYIGKEVEILVLPCSLEEYRLWSEKELKEIGKIGFCSDSFEEDDEDYSKW
jgi:hypothetical protein